MSQKQPVPERTSRHSVIEASGTTAADRMQLAVPYDKERIEATLVPVGATVYFGGYGVRGSGPLLGVPIDSKDSYTYPGPDALYVWLPPNTTACPVVVLEHLRCPRRS